jgi:hypothetical protein
MRKLLISAFGAVLVGLTLIWSQPSTAWLAQRGSGGGGGGITFVASAHGFGLTDPTTANVNMSTANFIVLNVSAAAPPASIDDSQGNTYTSTSNCGSATIAGCLYYKYAPTVSSSMHWTVHGTVAASIQVLGFSGTTGSGIDQDNTQAFNSGAATTCPTNTITPSAGAVVISGVSFQNDGGSATYSIDNSFALTVFDPFVAATAEGGGIAYKLGVVGAITPTWTDTGTSSPVICSLTSFL